MGIIQSVTGAIDKMPVLGNQSFIGKHILMTGQTNQHFGRDAVTWLRNTPKTSGFFNRLFRVMFPAPIRPALAKAVSGFTKLPLMNRVSIWAQWGLAFDAVIGTYTGLKDGLKGYQNSTGNVVQKTASGVKAGIKSALQTSLVMAATLVGAFGLPALLGASVLSASGVIAGIIGSSVLRSYMEKFVGHKKEKEAEQNAALSKVVLPVPIDALTSISNVNTPVQIIPNVIQASPQISVATPNIPNPFMNQ